MEAYSEKKTGSNPDDTRAALLAQSEKRREENIRQLIENGTPRKRCPRV